MKNKFLTSFVGGLAPVVIFAIIALTQHGEYSYTKLGGVVILVQAGYVVLLFLAMILLFILKKKDIARGLLVSFIIGFFITVIIFGMGL